MKTFVRCFWVLLMFSEFACAQTGSLVGYLYNEKFQHIENATLLLKEVSRSAQSDSAGRFIFSGLPEGQYTVMVSKLGFEQITKTIRIQSQRVAEFSVCMKENYINLKELYVKGSGTSFGNTINKIDRRLRPLNSSQDLLRLVPGLFIAQHAGGGKAEQIFLRGFDVDHGTDFAMYVDGMPVNITSHAHGQGYADLHFVIPETVKELEVNKGPYATKYGDLATSGAGEFRTMSVLAHNQVKLEYGLYNTQRALAMINILDKKHLFTKRKENLYVAAEYKYTDAYFESKQHFSRVNLFAKYTAQLHNGSQLTINASTFHSNWDASGQIPERKVNDGSITDFGSIDDTEGGETGRTNFTLIHIQPVKKGSIKNQVYYSKYDFNLYSNFTFFLNDSVLGDQIRQGDDRNILGYSGSFSVQHSIGSMSLSSVFATGFRYDNADIHLSHTRQRAFLNDVVQGKLNQINTWVYADETMDITKLFKINAGARLDVYHFSFQNRTDEAGSGNTIKALVSPKLSFLYDLRKDVQLFVKSGFGFHSNDARAVVVGRLDNTLPRALGYEAGSTFKPLNNLIMNAAIWALHLQSELVYVGDEGVVEASGRTRRLGIDLGARYQLTKHWFIDADLNYNKGVLVDEPSDANHIPLAPVVTSIGGISYIRDKGFNGALRYRFMGDRAANEDYSIEAKGYFLADAVINYTTKRYQLNVTVENIFNTNWREAQFATESRLQNETVPVEEIHFTPGTPFFVKGGISIFF